MTRSCERTEVWRARIEARLAADLRADAAALGLSGRADVVRTALRLWHQTVAEERMAKDADEFYGGRTPRLPIGVRAATAARPGQDHDHA